mmetsp:Transcript_28408/g.50751  ORF Transcript_28408/g.50751 Transcript_28408/m.50751 type:complete len:215 (+) Transcript_28408:1980-2624(+)
MHEVRIIRQPDLLCASAPRCILLGSNKRTPSIRREFHLVHPPLTRENPKLCVRHLAQLVRAPGGPHIRQQHILFIDGRVLRRVNHRLVKILHLLPLLLCQQLSFVCIFHVLFNGQLHVVHIQRLWLQSLGASVVCDCQQDARVPVGHSRSTRGLRYCNSRSSSSRTVCRSPSLRAGMGRRWEEHTRQDQRAEHIEGHAHGPEQPLPPRLLLWLR